MVKMDTKMNKYILGIILMVASIFSVKNIAAQNNFIDSVYGELINTGDTSSINLVIYFQVVNIDSLDEFNVKIFEDSGDSISILGKLVSKEVGGYKILINGSNRFISDTPNSFQALYISIPDKKKKLDYVDLEVKRKGNNGSKLSTKIKKIKL